MKYFPRLLVLLRTALKATVTNGQSTLLENSLQMSVMHRRKVEPFIIHGF